MMRLLALLIIAFTASFSAMAQISEAEIDAKAREVNRALRCVVCQNQSIDESDAPLAADMRMIVRRQISAGQSKTQIIAYMRENYGDYVLLKPPVQSNTLVLWFVPFLLVFGGLIWFIRTAKRSGGSP